MYNSLDGFSVNLVGGWFKTAPPGPIPIGVSISPAAILATSGSRAFSLTYDNQGRVPGWRFLAIAGYDHNTRAPYFGLGNATAVNDSLQSANGGDTHFYRYALQRTTGIAAVEHRIAGPLRVHVGAQYRRYRAEPLGGLPTAFGADVAGGVTADTGSRTGVEVRGALIFDTRNEEATPSSGLFVAVIGARAVKGAGDFDYSRGAVDVREYFPLNADSTVVLASRQTVTVSSDAIPFYVAAERLTTWRPEDGFGGATTLRQNLPGRWVGPNDALASLDLRYKYWDSALGLTPIRLWLVTHADVGRVWGWGSAAKFGWQDLHSGYGVGLMLQVSRASVFGVEVGYSPDAHIQFGTTATLGY